MVLIFESSKVTGMRIEPIHLSTETSAAIVAGLVAARGNVDKPVEDVNHYDPEKTKFRFYLQETDNSHRVRNIFSVPRIREPNKSKRTT